VLLIPRDMARVMAAAGSVSGGLLISPEAFALMAQDWRYSSSKAKKELGYRARGVETTLRETVEWYVELMRSGALDGGRPSPMSLGSLGMRVAARMGGLRVAHAVESWTGRRFVAAG
jgi:hypothetical protein